MRMGTEVLEELRNKLLSGKVAIQESVTKIKLLLSLGGILPQEEWQRSGIGSAIAF